MASYYLILFMAATAMSLIFTGLVRDAAIRRKLFDNPKIGRHLHLRPVPRIGGVSIALTFAIVTGFVLFGSRLLRTQPSLSFRTTLGIILPASLIFLLGLFDDHFSLGAYSKFAVQVIAAIWLYWGGFGIHILSVLSSGGVLGTAIGLPLTIFWVLLITNAFNLIDGLDGLSAGAALFSTSIIFAVSLFRHTQLISLLSIVLAGAIFGFLRYNFHPASIFLGDSGSLFIGFLLSALALASSQKSTTAVAVAIPVVAFGLPLLDVCISVFRRFMNHRPLFLGDADHVHHKLLKLGFSHRSAVLVLYAVAAAFGLLSLVLLHGEVMFGIVLLLVGFGVALGVNQLKYLEFYELMNLARRVWRRKRVTANNLQVRRAIESLRSDGLEFTKVCRNLQAALDPTGFCGFTILFSTLDHAHEEFLFPLRRDGANRYSHFWVEFDSQKPEWELKLELTSMSGTKIGDIYLIRERASDPLFVDVNLLSDEFRTAVADVVGRAVGQILVERELREKPGHVMVMRTAGEA